MRYPFALPAAALLIGVVAGAHAGGASSPLLAGFVSTCWILSIGMFIRGLPALVCVWIALGFAGSGVALGSSATRAALTTPLRECLVREGLLSPAPAVRGAPITIEGTLREDARDSESGVTLSVAVESASIAGLARRAPGGVVVSVAGAPPRSLIDRWRAGRRVRFPVMLRRPARYLDPGVPDGELALARRGTTLVGSVKSALLVEIVAEGGWITEAAAKGRRIVRHAIGETVGHWSRRSAGIVTAILIGDRTGLDATIDRRLQDAGTYHVIAISGGNIAILAGLFLGGLRVVGLSRRGWNAVPIAALWSYAYLVGTGASVSRATLMGVVFLSARLFDFGSTPLNAWCVSGALILTRWPLALFDAGFILTFGATLGILVGAGIVQQRPKSRVLRVGWALLAASLAAETVLLPVQASLFSRVTFAGLLLNFAAIPLMGVAQIAGMAAVALQPIADAPARLAGLAGHVGAAGLVESARFIDLVPWLVRRVPPPSPIAIVVFYVAIVIWVAADRIVLRLAINLRTARRVAAAGTLGAACWILVAPSVGLGAGSVLRIRFLDVGQGDSALVEFPNGRTLLIDTGGVLPAGRFEIGERVVEPVLWWAGIRRLDYLALTHGDPDHIGGAPAIMRDFRPREIWTGVPVPAHRSTNELREQARTHGTAWRTLQTGNAMEIGDTNLRVWHPPLPDWERQKVRNDDSLVIEVRKGNVSVLLTGDIGRDGERELVPLFQSGDNMIRVLKVPHHGSLTSSSSEFIAALAPAAAVVSAGRDNHFGHPVPQVLDRYLEAGAVIFRTDVDGMVTLETDGRSARLTSFTGRTWTRSTR